MEMCESCGGTTFRNGRCVLCDMLVSHRAPGGHRSECWPMHHRYALTVFPDQVAEANEVLRRHGCAVRHRPDGTADVPSAAEYKKFQRIRGAFNKDDFC